MTQCKGFVEDRDNLPGIVIGGNPVNGQGLTFSAFVNQHQFAARFSLILVLALFQGQTDRFHRRFAGGQTVAGRVQIQMT
ncbi:MAG TPA: hypothetical protein VFZ43_01115 [Anaerolineales bacterium]